EMRARASEAIAEWRSVRRALAELNTGAREREQRRDLLSFQVNEIDETSPEPGEDEALRRERDVLQNADELRISALKAVESLTGEASDVNAIGMLREMEHSVLEAAALDSGAQPLGERATEILVLAEDLARDVR